VSDAILPVGRDCVCGYPMIWRAGAQICAVYGTHPASIDHSMFTDAPEGNPIHFRNYAAAGASLVDACLAAPNTTRNATRLRALRAVS
jgi:hypothetical protein